MTNQSVVGSLRIRRARSQDITSMVQIANDAYAKSYEFTPFRGDDFELSKPNSFALVAEKENAILGCAMVESRAVGAESVAEMTVVAAQPHLEVAAIEQALIEACEKTTNAQSITIYLAPDDPKLSWLAGREYSTEPGFCHFVAFLRTLPSEPTESSKPDSIHIRSMRASEEDHVIKVVNAAYGRERLSKTHFERWRKEDPMFNEEWILLAVSQGKIVGVVCSRQDLRYNQIYHKRRGYLGPAGTLPEFRSKGVNKTLNWSTMKFLREKGMEEVSLYTAENNDTVHKLANDLGYEHRYVWKCLKKTFR